MIQVPSGLIFKTLSYLKALCCYIIFFRPELWKWLQLLHSACIHHRLGVSPQFKVNLSKLQNLIWIYCPKLILLSWLIFEICQGVFVMCMRNLYIIIVRAAFQGNQTSCLSQL